MVSVSYSQIEEISTALCVHKPELSIDKFPLPEDIVSHVFTTFAWDNIDRLEATLSGEGTSHRVNRIAVQAKVAGAIPQVIPPVATRTKKRSISPAPLLLPIYNAGKRPEPPMTETLYADTTKEVHDAKVKNHIWLLTRMSPPENQTISS